MSKKRIRAQFYDAGPQHNLAWWTLPATAEAYEQMVEQMECAIGIANFKGHMPAAYALAAIGITPPKKGTP